MITLAIDTSEARGSVAVMRDGTAVSQRIHDDGTDYSAWLLPAVENVLGEAGASVEQVDLFAVSTGPGSFTGLRVGLTSVKAWAEVYGKRIVGVPRLEAMARSEVVNSGLVAASFNAHRGQVFSALYRTVAASGWDRIGDETVCTPDEFVAFVDGRAGAELVAWVCLDPDLIENAKSFAQRVVRGDKLVRGSAVLAPVIGRLAEARAAKGEFTDPVALDANYVRRSDAEIFWKGPSVNAR